MSETFEDRIRSAYFEMATKARYRPQAPGDGMGNVNLTEGESEDPVRLKQEADEYVKRFIAQERTLNFRIGVGDWTNARALVYSLEAAKALCGGALGVDVAIDLLELATAEARKAKTDWKDAISR